MTFGIKELENLYDNTMGIHFKKHNDVISQLNNCNDLQLRLHIYIADIVDLIFYFNSFLLLYNVGSKKSAEKDSFKYKSNDNNLYDLLDIALKNNPLDGLYIDRIRIYEYLFRHMHAHGNTSNLINIILLRGPDQPPFFMLVKKGYQRKIKSSNNKKHVQSIRILLDKNLFKKNKKLLSSMYDKSFYKRKFILGKFNGVRKRECFYLLNEESSRSYMKLSQYKFNFENNVKLNHTFQRFFNNFNYDINNLITVGVMNSDKDKVKVPSSYISYESIRNDLEFLIFHIASE